MKLPHQLKAVPFIAKSIILVLITALVAYLNIKLNSLEKSLKSVESSQSYFSSNFSDALFEDHLKVTQAMVDTSKLSSLQDELNKLKDPQTVQDKTIQDAYNTLLLLEQKISRNKKAGLNEPDLSALKTTWGEMLLNKDFKGLVDGANGQITLLDTDYGAYLKKLEQTRVTASGYSYQNVKTERGTFGVHVIKIALKDVKVKTVSAASGSCSKDCDTKSLADYVKDSGGFAGMNGSYFCPPDYPSCDGKVNSFDFALYDSHEGRWEHKDALSWFKTGLMTFNGSDPDFYRKSSDYGGGGVTAGISNYPSLVKNGDIVVDDDELTSYQKDVKGPRGVIGMGGENLYLAIVNGANVRDAAYVIRALGAKDALNLDGGGSSAMYINGKYVVGPGRSLPNAIILSK